MNTKNIVFSYLITFVIFLIIDMLWLGFIAKDIYEKYLGDFLSDNINWTVVFVFYIIYVLGIFLFAIHPSISKKSAYSAILLGALFGFFTYTTYDLTNLATLKNWPLPIVIIDIMWGTVLSSIVSLSGFYIIKWVNEKRN